MADPKQQPLAASPLKRAAERVIEARTDYASHIFQGRNLLHVGPKGGGCPCDAMALHPAGLLVVPSEGPHKGCRVLIPFAHVEYAKVSPEET